MAGLRLIGVRARLLLFLATMLNASTGIPEGVVPVRNFELHVS
jgi:hypothetical protein